MPCVSLSHEWIAPTKKRQNREKFLKSEKNLLVGKKFFQCYPHSSDLELAVRDAAPTTERVHTRPTNVYLIFFLILNFFFILIKITALHIQLHCVHNQHLWHLFSIAFVCFSPHARGHWINWSQLKFGLFWQCLHCVWIGVHQWNQCMNSFSVSHKLSWHTISIDLLEMSIVLTWEKRHWNCC